MDYTDEELEDLAKMRELRLRLRACADAKVAECEAMHPGKTWLEIYRQMRAIEAADRMVVRLYAPPPKRRAKRAETSVTASPARPRKTLGDLAGEAAREAEAASSLPHFPSGTSVPGEVSAQPTEGAKLIDEAKPPVSNDIISLLPCASGGGGAQVTPQAERVETEGAACEDAPAPALSPDSAPEPLLSEAMP